MPAQHTPALVLTRPAEDAAAFASALRQLCDVPFNLISAPVLEIVFHDLPGESVNQAERAEAIIFTSANAVRAAARAGLPIKPAFCVGAITAQLAAEAGFQVVAHARDVAGLITMIDQHRPKSAFYARGVHVKTDLAAALAAFDVTCHSWCAYDQEETAIGTEVIARLRRGNYCVLPLFSERSSRLVLAQVGTFGAVGCVAISENVAAVFASQTAVKMHIASAPGRKEMISATCEMLKHLSK